MKMFFPLVCIQFHLKFLFINVIVVQFKFVFKKKQVKEIKGPLYSKIIVTMLFIDKLARYTCFIIILN